MTFLILGCIIYGKSTAEDVDALSDFGMIHREVDSNTFLNSDFVVTRGVTSRFWDLACSAAVLASGSVSSTGVGNASATCKPVVSGPFSDQVTFEFAFSDPAAYSFKRPQVSASGGRAHPTVEDFFVNPDENSGEVSILSGCSAPSRGAADRKTTAISQIQMRFEVRPNVSIGIGWIKLCGGGENSHIDHGFDIVDASGLHRRVSLSDGERSAAVLSPVFGSGFPSTRVYLKFKSGKQSQLYAKPVLHQTDRGIVDLDIRGSKYGGLLTSSAVATFDVIYHCKERATSEIMLRIPIPPFDDIKIRWLKDCGGGIEPSINVGTRGFINSNVIRGGMLRPGFGSQDKIDHHANDDFAQVDTVLGADEAAKTFFIWNRHGANIIDHPVRFGALSLTCEHDDVVMATTASRKAPVAEALGIFTQRFKEHGETLEPNERRYMEIQTTCLRNGFSRILVTIPIRDRSPIEWSFTKECRRPRAKRRATLTAGDFLNWSLFLFALSIVFLLAKRTYSYHFLYKKFLLFGESGD